MVPHPRWVRVNLLKADMEAVVRELDEHLWRMTVRQIYTIGVSCSSTCADLLFIQRFVPMFSFILCIREFVNNLICVFPDVHVYSSVVELSGTQGPAERVSGGQQDKEEKTKRKSAPLQPAPQPPPQPPQTHRTDRDTLLPDLLSLPAGTALHDHPLVTCGSVVLQSKASCLPAHALAPEPGWTVVDCCAAPGNKTTHLASIMGNKGPWVGG